MSDHKPRKVTRATIGQLSHLADLHLGQKRRDELAAAWSGTCALIDTLRNIERGETPSPATFDPRW